MNKTFLVPALGALILGSSSLAFAGDADPATQVSALRYVHDDGRRGWRDDDWRGERGWGHDRGPAWGYRHEHHHHHHHHWHPRHWHHDWHPAPPWGHYDRQYFGGHDGYGRDGVSIILRGHFDD